MLSRHLNGDRKDSRLCNLAYGTPKENRADAVSHGSAPRGENHANAKLTESDVLDIRRSTDNQPTLAKRFGVSETTISLIRHRRTWQSLMEAA